MLLAGLTLLNDMLVTSGISNRIQWLYFLPIFYTLSVGPLFYLFIKSKYRTSLKSVDYLHLIIPLIQAVVYFSIGFRSAKFKSDLWLYSDFPVYLEVESILFPISIGLYTVLSYLILKRDQEQPYFWSKDLRKWLLQFTKGMFIIAAMELGFSLLELVPNFSFSSMPVTIVQSLILSSFVFWIALNGFKQYLPLQVYTSQPDTAPVPFDTKEYDEIASSLETLMVKEHIYLNPDLTLEVLASYLSIPEKSCSHLLNTVMQSNFNTVVNDYRITAFKQKIADNELPNFTLTAIAYECGFNSKSTFNRVFKKRCGLTPSEYVKSLQ